MRRLSIALILLTACRCDDFGLRSADKMTLEFITPHDGDAVEAGDTVSVEVQATNPAGIDQFVLSIGTRELLTCPGAGAKTHQLSCTTFFIPADFADQFVDDTLALKATATSHLGRTTDATIHLTIRPAPTVITIDTPAPDLVAKGSDQVRLHATARNPSGLRTLSLSAGSDALMSCEASEPGARFVECEDIVVPASHVSQIVNGRIALHARALDTHEGSAEVTQDLLIDLSTIATTVIIDSPAPGTVANVDSWVRLHATASNLGGVKLLDLFAGASPVGSCTATTQAMESLACEAMLAPREHLQEIVDNKIVLKARARDYLEADTEATVELGIDPASLAIVVTIVNPAAGTMLSHRAPVSFQAHAEASQGLQDLALMAGATELTRCTPSGNDQILDCSATLQTTDVWMQLASGQLTLTAIARDHGSGTGQASATFAVEPLSVTFVQPMATQQNPPRAAVHGSGTLEVAAQGSAPVTSIDVTLLDGTPVRSFTATPYRATINWTNLLNTGGRTLKAVAHDASGATAEATLELVVACSADSECRTGERCCSETGTCNPIVAAGADCDCTHPCAASQGCFPGTCGQAPRKCRPGCFPGSQNVRADRCADEDGSPAYCATLPTAEQTTANRGGACAPADDCDVYTQNCPALPLDRSQPLSASNPAVPYMCVPVSPTRNGCFPAGGRAVGQTCAGPWLCTGNLQGGACVKGALCVLTSVAGIPIGSPTCRKMCAGPFGYRSTCSAGQICNGNLSGAGREPYPEGTCE